jgi:hypothetical protein
VTVVRALAVGGLVGLSLGACAAHRAIDPAPDTAQPFVSDVTDAEWQAAIPTMGSSIAEPRLLRGKANPDAQGVLKVGETALATVEIVIRADGTVGLHRIVSSTNPRFTERVIQALRSQVYEHPMLNGSAVATRGEVSFQSTRTQ